MLPTLHTASADSYTGPYLAITAVLIWIGSLLLNINFAIIVRGWLSLRLPTILGLICDFCRNLLCKCPGNLYPLYSFQNDIWMSFVWAEHHVITKLSVQFLLVFACNIIDKVGVWWLPPKHNAKRHFKVLGRWPAFLVGKWNRTCHHCNINWLFTLLNILSAHFKI